MGTNDRAAPGIPQTPKGKKGTSTDSNVSRENDPKVLSQEADMHILGKGSRRAIQLAMPTRQALAHAEKTVGTRT